MLAHRTQVVTKETVRFGRKTPCLIDVVNGTQEPVYVLLSSYDVEWISVQDTFTELIEPKFMRPLTVDLFDPYCIQVQLAEIFAAFLWISICPGFCDRKQSAQTYYEAPDL